MVSAHDVCGLFAFDVREWPCFTHFFLFELCVCWNVAYAWHIPCIRFFIVPYSITKILKQAGVFFLLPTVLSIFLVVIFFFKNNDNKARNMTQ